MRVIDHLHPKKIFEISNELEDFNKHREQAGYYKTRDAFSYLRVFGAGHVPRCGEYGYNKFSRGEVAL